MTRIETGSRLALVAVLLEGLRRRDPAAVVNAVASVAGTYLPSVLERRADVAIRPWHRGYVSGAMVAHAVGMLGPYDDVRWWDHLTHTLTATILGEVVHVIARERGADPRPRVLGAVVGLGALWEVLEYVVHTGSRRVGLDPVLVQYSATDTAFDLVFNLVGAGLVVLFGDRVVERVASETGLDGAGTAADAGTTLPTDEHETT
jgi:hypothetical protein